MFSYVSFEARVPAAHPLRKLRAVVDALLATMTTLRYSTLGYGDFSVFESVRCVNFSPAIARRKA